MSDQKPKLDSLFAAAVELESAAERAVFLEQACGGNRELRKQVELLLQSDQQAGSFLEKPPAQFEQTMLHDGSGHNLAAALDAGLAAAFDLDKSVVMGNPGHSVLNAMGQTIDIPRVVLREAAAEGPEPIMRSKSPEMPKGNSDSRYQLQGEIARGGMGAVLKGRDTDLGRDLAIKVLLDQHKNKPEVVQRFIEEAQIGGQLQHPGIAPIYELGQFADKRPFFSMKLVKGKTLANLLADREDATEDRGRFIGIFEQICQTMAYAHSRGVIHRDLKPANIMVGAFGEVQVMDWGLAKVLSEGGIADEKTAHTKHKDFSIIQTMRSIGSDSPGSFGTVGSHTQMGSVMGTPAYMPPEQALGEIDQLDERADVFGLGAILCEILTGKPPYVANDGTQVFRMASRGKLEDCFQRLDACGADEDLIGLAKHCLQLEPKDRPRNAGVLATEVTEYLESVETKLREAEIGRATQAARADAESHQAEAERRQAEAERQRADAESQRAKSQSQAARRLRVIVACVALVAVLAGATAVLFQRYGAKQVELAEQQNHARAATLVDGLLNAEIVRVPGILQQVELEREWVDPLLAAQRTEHAGVPQIQRRLALTLRSPPQDVETLREWLLVADVDDLPVVRQVLNGQPELVRASFWKVALDSQLPSEKRLRAACALATLDPKHADWSRLGTFAANQLLEQPVLLLDKWSDLLRPVHGHLLDQLAIAFRDTAEEQRARREIATVLLAKQFRSQSDVLVDLLLDADAQQFEAILNPLQQDRERAITLLEAAMGKDFPVMPSDGQQAASLANEVAAFQKQIRDNQDLLSLADWRKIKTLDNLKGIETIYLERRNRDARLQHASRQANAAVALARLGETRNVWPLLRETPHPDARSFLIHRLGPYGVDLQLVVDRLAAETDVSIRRALILSLNEFPEEALKPIRAGLTTDLLARYRSDPDPGIHAATSWLLYKWGQLNQVFGIDFAQKAVAPQPASRWYVNGDLQTMVMLPPGTFARATGPENQASPSHRIDRAFAIGSTLIPPKGKWPLHQSGESGNWFSAAAYCNELSKREGIPPDQWCYEMNPERGDAIWLDENKNNYARLAPDYLSRTGYRMPTEAEWEYACRAGTVTSRFYGDSDRLLEHYAWFRGNTNRDYPSRTATLKPNDFGLFDMVGNRRQICVGRFTEQVPGLLPRWDLEMSDLVVKHDGTQILRGTDYNAPLAETTAAARDNLDEIYSSPSHGLRVVRTLPLDMCRAAFGDDHPATCGALYSEAILALGRGDQERVAALDQQLLEHASAAMGKDPERWRTALRFAARLAHRRGQHDLARQRCDELLADSPPDLSLAELRLESSGAEWTVLKPIEMTSEGGATLTLQEDSSVLAQGENSDREKYRLVLETNLQTIAGFRLEVMTDERLPQKGPGRGARGNFSISWEFSTAGKSAGDAARPLQIQTASADYSHPKIPITTNAWNIEGGAGKPHAAFLQLETPLPMDAQTQVILTISGPAGKYSDQDLGRFRLSVTDDPNAFKNPANQLVAMKVTDQWAKIAAVYDLSGNQQASDKLLEQHPQAAAGIGDFYAAAKDWQRAITIYSKAIAPETNDAALLTKRATAYKATQQWDLASADLSRALQHSPDSVQAGLAGQLADLLLTNAKQSDTWTVLTPSEMKSQGGATLTLLDDHSILASGTNAPRDQYNLAFVLPQEIDLRSVRLEALTDPSLPANGPGRATSGSFVLKQWQLTATPKAGGEPATLKFDAAAADYEFRDYPIKPNGWWSIDGGPSKSRVAIWRTEQPSRFAQGTTLQLQLNSVNGERVTNLGRFRLSVSADPNAIENLKKRVAALKITDPWAKLATAYELSGNQQAYNKLLEQHPQAAERILEFYAAQKEWQRAIAEYSKLITDQTTDVTLLSKRAAAYIATEQWDLAEADWLRVIQQQPDQAQKAFDAFKMVNRLEQAVKMLEESLQLISKENGPEHPNTLTAMGKLADAYGTAGRKEEVLKLREELVSLLRKVKGPEDPGVLWNSHQIARLYSETGRPDEALKLREEMLPIVRKVNGPKDPFTLQIMNKLAELYDATGRKDDAARLRAEVGKLQEGPPTATNVVDPKPSSEDPQRAIAEYSKRITDQTTDVTLLSKRAAAYIATAQWELAKADWLRVIKQQPDQAQKAFDAFKIAKRWQEAAEFGGNVIERDPKKTMSWLQQAPVIVLAGDAAAYRAFCERMVKQFGANVDDTSSTHTLKACLLQPGMIDLARLPVAVFEKRLDDGTTPEGTRHFRWGLRGLLALRSGKPELAVKYIGQAQELNPTDLSRAMNLSVLALAQYELQHPDEAKATLATAAQLIAQIKKGPGNAPGNKVSHDQQIAEILFLEAEAKIKQTAAPDKTTD